MRGWGGESSNAPATLAPFCVSATLLGRNFHIPSLVSAEVFGQVSSAYTRLRNTAKVSLEFLYNPFFFSCGPSFSESCPPRSYRASPNGAVLFCGFQSLAGSVLPCFALCGLTAGLRSWAPGLLTFWCFPSWPRLKRKVNTGGWLDLPPPRQASEFLQG